MTPEQIAQLQRFQAGEQLSDEEMSALYPAMVDEQIKRAKGAQAREFIFNALSQGIRAATGLPFQQSLRNRRLAADAQQRALAREAADQDPTSARTKYFELKQNFIDGIVDAAQASVTPENEAEIKQAELLAQREAKLLDMIQGGDKGEVSKEDTKARMAATRFINAVSRGQSSKNALIGQLSPLNTQYALDRFSYWVNTLARDVTPISDSENASNAPRINDRFGNQGLDPSLEPGDTQAQFAGLTKNHVDDILTTMGRRDGEGFYDPVEYGGAATLPESYMLDSEYMKQRQAIIDAGTLAENPGGFSGAQLLVLDTGDVRQAMQRSKEALDDLSDLPDIEQQIKKSRAKTLTASNLQSSVTTIPLVTCLIKSAA